MIIFQSDKFIKTDVGITHGFFGRQGGVSTGIYESLNCSWGSSDERAAIAENRARVGTAMGMITPHVITPYQHHSADCLMVDCPLPEGDDKPKGDALVTDKQGLLIGILTADCGPVLFHGTKADGSPVIGAAHAGWGGAVKGVLENTVAQMVKMGAALTSISACVGPCIGQKSYEVSQGFEKPFLVHSAEAERFFKETSKAAHMMFDLSGYIAFRLAGCGVSQVILSDIDTYADEIRCFSYRRATHRGQTDYGRQISAIMIMS